MGSGINYPALRDIWSQRSKQIERKSKYWQRKNSKDNVQASQYLAALDLLDALVELSDVSKQDIERYKLASQNSRLQLIETAISTALGGVGVITGGAALVAFGAGFGAWKFFKTKRMIPIPYYNSYKHGYTLSLIITITLEFN